MCGLTKFSFIFRVFQFFSNEHKKDEHTELLKQEKTSHKQRKEWVQPLNFNLEL